MKPIARILMIIGPCFLPALAWAHEGHGHDNPLSPGHYVTNPEHSLQLVLIVTASIAFAWLINRSVGKVTEQK